ncbi:hypothetical protein GF378_01215 [Candidatus Pacearchaeota archaeon]|nr:hypothetical protein [Candidatus Pacearchaeota archaeon]
MPLILDFGKYKGMSLEEVALGRHPPKEENPKSEGYFYFFQLIQGDPKYFSRFRIPENIERWTEIHKQLNNFKAIESCENCGEDSTLISIAGDNSGYSFYPYVCCDRLECKEATISKYRSKLSFTSPQKSKDIRKKRKEKGLSKLGDYFDEGTKEILFNGGKRIYNLDKFFYPIGFDTILRFGWSKGGNKSDEFQAYRLMMYLAGWPKGKVLNKKSATEFIDELELRD